MRQFLLASALILAAVGMFFGGRAVLMPAEMVAVGGPVPGGPVLGDLSAMVTIVDEVSGIAAKGDLPAAKARIATLETAWDDAEPAMRPLNPEAWGRVDAATDAALKSLRVETPDAATVTAALVALRAALDDPAAATGGTRQVKMVGGIAVTDASGHAIPCEAMLTEVGDKMAASPLAKDQTLTDLVAKATERCNADDDTRADEFSAQALGLLGGK